MKQEIADHNLLFKSFTLKNGVKIKNRFFKSAMSEQLGTKTHLPSKELCFLYERWALGGCGVLVTGNVMIDSMALGEPRNVVLEDEANLDLFRKWARAGTQNNTQLWMQLNHPGKQIPKFLTKEPVAPSAVALGGGLERVFNTPRPLTHKEIQEIIARFAHSARLAKEAGFSGVQIHGAHGYLVSQFLSPKHNVRDDQWGGSLKNRSLFLMEVYRAIRQAVGKKYPVAIKLNSADFQRGGFSEKDSLAVIKMIADEGIDLIEISGGTYESPAMTGNKSNAKKSTIDREAYFLDFARKARKIVQTPLVVTGGFRTKDGMTQALQSNACDLIGIARPLCILPELPNVFESTKMDRIDLPTPSTGFAILDKMSMLGITWYEHQLHLLGKGKEPNPNSSAWLSMFETMMNTGLSSFRKRRG